ncbi:hypothetical protein BK011_06700 [Tenericutes bacterium MZ-XQ]|jgi:hypothetical protein|nr:hypothetical protein BK011_06700 [Tenericutes bacterium MZ-XQ]
MTKDQFMIDNKAKITYAVGFDTSDEDTNARIEMLIEAGIADLQQAGVKDEVIFTNKLSVVALVQFVMDNLKMVPGEFQTSPVYLSNVQKLRYVVIPDAI